MPSSKCPAACLLVRCCGAGAESSHLPAWRARPVVTRERTPSGLQWVANELAAVAGELERVDEQLGRLTARRLQLEAHRASLSQVGAIMGVAELQALVPAVRMHKAYGGRGFLVDWVRGVLHAAAPRPVDMRTLMLLAEEQFKLELPTSETRGQYRKNTLGRAVRKLLALGLVERLHDPDNARGPGRWRWKTQLPELSELLDGADAMEAS